MNTLEEMNEYIDDFHYYDIIDGRKITVNDVHLEARLFFRDGYLQETRENLRDCISQYMALFGEHITWGFDPRKHKWQQKTIDKLPSFNEVLMEYKDPDDCIEWFVSAGSHTQMEEAVAYQLFCITERAWKIEDISELHFRMHRADFFDTNKRISIINLFNYCIHKLNPHFAYMGWGAATGYHSEYTIDVLNQCKKFLGINVHDIWDTVVLHHGTRSIDWWTYISDDLAARIGGRNTLLAQVHDKSITHILYDCGVLLIAADMPQLLPINQPIPSNYLDINNICRPMRNGHFGSLGNGYDAGVGQQSFSVHLTDLWLRRFDDVELWRTFPEKPKLSITGEPIKTAKNTVINLNTGDICQQDGRYQYANEYDYNRNEPVYHHLGDDGELLDYHQYVVLKKGDIAPYFIRMDKNWRIIETMSIEWILVETL